MSISYDYIIVGSGFGGSVSALRLAEKGYKVAVIEQGKRYNPEDFPKTNWNFHKFLWMPKLACYGIQAMTLLKDVFILHGTGVGGGSLVYANNLLIPPDEVFDDPQWGSVGWKQKLLPYYEIARNMLGANPSRVITKSDEMLRECAAEIGKGDTFHINDVGIYFGKEGETVSDPYFGGKGPDRTGCVLCGGCMVGCRYGAKNSLDRNYLFLAERIGVDIIPETKVVDIKPDINGGYELTAKKITGFVNSHKIYKTAGVILSGGVMGTIKLLFRCKSKGSLNNISDCLGDFIRTNSEALVGARANNKKIDYSNGISITSGIYPDKETHIEAVRYSKGQDAMSLLGTILVDGGKFWNRPLRFLGNVFRHPLKFIKMLYPFGWAERTTILLVMQKIDNYMRFEYKRRWWRLGLKSMNSNWNTDKKIPSYIPVANDFAKRLARKMEGDPLSVLPEVLFDTSSTAHILGGCIMSDNPESGVIDFSGKIHGYNNLYVVDGSIIPVNLGVNPSLTITALAEYILDRFPEKSGIKSNE